MLLCLLHAQYYVRRTSTCVTEHLLWEVHLHTYCRSASPTRDSLNRRHLTRSYRDKYNCYLHLQLLCDRLRFLLWSTENDGHRCFLLRICICERCCCGARRETFDVMQAWQILPATGANHGVHQSYDSGADFVNIMHWTKTSRKKSEQAKASPQRELLPVFRPSRNKSSLHNQ